MRRLLPRPALLPAILLALLFSSAAQSQDRSARLDQAYEEARAAYNALREAESRRDEGVASLPGERIGSAAGGSRPRETYFARQAMLEQQVEAARRRHEAAMRRWNDLK